MLTNSLEYYPNWTICSPACYNRWFLSPKRFPPQASRCNVHINRMISFLHSHSIIFSGQELTERLQILGLLSSILLAIWTIPVGLKWFAFFITRGSVAYGPLSMSWANEICSGDAEERALVLGIMNAAGYAFNAW